MVDALTQTYNDALAGISTQLGLSLENLVVILTIISIWSLIWKGFALWKAAGKKSPVWFIVLLVLNDFGILEILYLFVFSKFDIFAARQVKPVKPGKSSKSSKKKK